MNEPSLTTLATLVLLVATACSESSNASDAAATDSSVLDSSVVDGAAADAATSESRVDAGPSDLELLQACEAEEPCTKRSYAQKTEGGRRATIWAEGTACILDGLEQRKPGLRYNHETQHTWTRGSALLLHLLMVRADGKVLYARMRTIQNRSDIEELREPTQLCTLRAPSYFAECAAAVRQVQPGVVIEDLPWGCAFGERVDDHLLGELEWFESCEPAPATCE